MEDNALRTVNGQVQDLREVPCDSLSLAVLIGCQPDGLRLACHARELVYNLALIFGYLVNGLKIFIEVYTKSLLRQVADVAKARLNLEVLAEELLDGLRLGGGLYNNQILHYSS